MEIKASGPLAHRANDVMGQHCRRMKGRLGKAEGIVAVAHGLARIVYAMVTTG